MIKYIYIYIYIFINNNDYSNNQMLGKGTGTLENQRKKRHLNYIILEVSQNTEKSSGDLRRLAVTQTALNDYQLTPI